MSIVLFYAVNACLSLPGCLLLPLVFILFVSHTHFRHLSLYGGLPLHGRKELFPSLWNTSLRLYKDPSDDFAFLLSHLSLFFFHFVCLKISLFLSSLFLKAIFSGHRVLGCSYFLSAHEGIIPLPFDFQCCCWVLCCQSHCHSFESNLSSMDAFMILSLLLGFFSFTMLCILTDFLIFTVCGDSLIFLNLYIGIFHLLWKIPKH